LSRFHVAYRKSVLDLPHSRFVAGQTQITPGSAHGKHLW
jgi:hypothetical protein